MESGPGFLAIFSCIAFSNFFSFIHWLQFSCGNEGSAFWQLPGSFCTLFLAILWLFSSWNLQSIGNLFCCSFIFYFSSHDDPSMSLTAVVKIPLASADFTLHCSDANFLFSVFNVVQGEAKTPEIMGFCRANFALLHALKVGTFRGKWALEWVFKTSNFFRLAVYFFKAGPLDLSFWSFLTFLHHGIEKNSEASFVKIS